MDDDLGEPSAPGNAWDVVDAEDRGSVDEIQTSNRAARVLAVGSDSVLVRAAGLARDFSSFTAFFQTLPKLWGSYGDVRILAFCDEVEVQSRSRDACPSFADGVRAGASAIRVNGVIAKGVDMNERIALE